MSKKRVVTKHLGTVRKCEKCSEDYEIVNERQRFCSRKCYSSWHSVAKNPESNAKRRNDGKYVWRHIKSRCNNPNDKAYKDYGEKGVECKFSSFEDFQRVYFRTNECEQCGIPLNDENRRGRDGRNIHRVESNLHYEESNCILVCKGCNNFLDRNDKRGWF